MDKRLYELIKKGQVMKFYKSKEWIELRDQVRLEQHYECQKCKEEGKVGPADVVHHIKPIRDFPLLALNKDNLLCLCHMHHEKEHPEKFEKANRMMERKERKQPKGWEEKW